MTEVNLTAGTIKSHAANREALNRLRDERMAALIEPLEARVEKSNGAGAEGSSAEPGKSNVAAQDPFHALTVAGRAIEPPFDMLVLTTLPEQSSELGQCIEALMTNIDATGHRYLSRLRLDDLSQGSEKDEQSEAQGVAKAAIAAAEAEEDDEDEAPPSKPKPKIIQLTPEQKALLEEAKKEKVRLTNFFTYATPESFSEFRQRLRRDIETTGNYYFEVLRNTLGEIQGFNHVPAYQMRLGKLDDDAALVDRKVLELQLDGSVIVKTIKEWRRFRRFVQSRYVHRSTLSSIQTGSRTVWYKEFGDVRVLSKSTGYFADEQSTPIKDNDHATELIHVRNYSARSPYGLPRYVGNLLSIFGDRAAEEINYTTFRNNNIPSLAILVSNGMLTEGTIQRIESFVESQIRGSSNYSKFLIIEAETLAEEGEDGGHIKVDIKPLTNDQIKDALFQEYSKNNQDKIRRSFRLPPIFVGRSDDYTRSTAESSRRLADEQIFLPERDKFDELMNRIIFPEMKVRFHKFKSNSPNTTDNESLVKILAGAEKTGGMTPRIARAMLEQILGIDLPAFPGDFPQDVPFSLTMAEAVKNQADAAEPGQQVTAIKALQMIETLTGDTKLDTDDDVVEVAKKLLALNKTAEMMWKRNVGEAA